MNKSIFPAPRRQQTPSGNAHEEPDPPFSQDSLDLVLEAAEIGMWKLDLSAGRLRTNRLHDAIFGYDEPVRTWSLDDYREHVLPEYRERFEQALSQALRSGVLKMEVPVHRADGARGWIHSCGRVGYDEDGRPMQIAGVTSDITERKQAEQRQQEQLQILSEAVAVLLGPGTLQEIVRELFQIIADRLELDLCFNYALDGDAQQLRLLVHAGLPEEDVRGIARLELGEAVCGTVAATGQPYYAAAVQQSDDPLLSFVRDSGGRAYACYPLTSGGCVIGTISFGRCGRDRFSDEERAFFETISHHVAIAMERWRYEEELRESKVRFQLLLNSAAEAIYGLDTQGNCTFVNNTCLRLLGYESPDELLGRNMHDLIHHTKANGEVYPGEECTIFRAFRKGEGVHLDDEVLWRKDGSSFPAEYWSHPVIHDGKIIGAVVSFFDITERRETQQQLKELNEELEARVEERTHQVRDLVSKLTRAEQEERRRIARILHDDLQQLLYAADMQLTMLGEGLSEADPTALADRLAGVHERVQQGITMTRQLTVDISPPILQKEKLTDIFEWLQRQMEDLHGLEITVEAERNFCIPDKDVRVLLFQTVRELLFNVKKHAGVDRARIEMEEEDGQLVIHVIDRGTGFAVAAEAGREDEAGGFGLFSARERLRLAGGRLDVRSQPGEGTHMTIHAPVAVNPSA